MKKEWMALPNILRRLFFAWLLAAIFAYLRLSESLRGLDGKEGLKEMSFSQMIIVVVALVCILSFMSRKINTEKMERWGIFIAFTVLCAFSMKASFSVSFLCGTLLLVGILGVYVFRGWRGETLSNPIHIRKSRSACMAVGIFALLIFIMASLWTVYRVRTYSAPTFDFGIFSQMFYQMKKTGLPYTTVERDGLLSHFSVHVSPIYYLMLPFYCLFPSPVTLQILQAVVITSAVIPTWKLTRKHGCTPVARALICLVQLLYPAFLGGASYDIHENAFLLPLVLWLFYAIDCEKRWAVFTCGILTLMVKEDAAVYVVVIALWLLLRSLLNNTPSQKWGVVTGGVMLGGALLWFFLVTGYLTRYGNGVMTYRYNNFIYDDSNTLFTVVKAALLSPMKVIYECTEPDRLPFIALTTLPVCGIFLFTRKYERYLLLIPLILVNLMPDYKYQHDVFYQYTYGTMACLFYLTIVNYEDIPEKGKKQFSLLAAFVISITCFVKNIVPQAVRYPLYYYRQKEHFQEIETLLETIPKDASVAATTFYTVPLSQRDILYDVRHSSQEHLLSTEYVVLEIGDKYSYTAYGGTEGEGYENLAKLLEENGYRVVGEMKNQIVIYSLMSQY